MFLNEHTTKLFSSSLFILHKQHLCNHNWTYKNQNQAKQKSPQTSKHYKHTLLPFENLKTMGEKESIDEAALEVGKKTQDWKWKLFHWLLREVCVAVLRRADGAWVQTHASQFRAWIQLGFGGWCRRRGNGRCSLEKGSCGGWSARRRLSCKP